jgi:predicted MFS family arabinose efflux permease
MSMSGLGALAGSLVLASLGDFRHKGLLLLGGTFAFGVTLAITGGMSSFMLAMAMMLFVGAAMTVFGTTANTLLMVLTPDEYRGRVMSVYMLDMALNAFGAMLAGVIADVIGIQWTLGYMGAICAVLAAVVFFVSPRIRSL